MAVDSALPFATIAKVDSKIDGDWQVDFYRNTAFPCAVSGYQTFVIGTKVSSNPTTPGPLFAKLHGGGVGYFDAAGNAMPNNDHKTEESMARLTNTMLAGISKEIEKLNENFRYLAVSMCSHDAYAGNNTPDMNNPRIVDGIRVRTNGLIHTKTAIAYAKSILPINKVVLSGGSAGSFGVFVVARSMEEEGIAPVAMIADSGVRNDAWDGAWASANPPQADTDCGRPADAYPLIIARFDPKFRGSENDGDLLYKNGLLHVPVAHVWSKNDNNRCGYVRMQCTDRQGNTSTMGSAECAHDLLRKELQSGRYPTSLEMKLCVDNTNASLPTPCDAHVPSSYEAANAVNTDLSEAPADFNRKLALWVQQRIHN